MKCSMYRLNKQGDSRQTCCTPFSILNQSVVSYRVLTVPSWTHIQVSEETGKVVWYSYLFKNFPQLIMICIAKGFSIVKETELDVFLPLPCFFCDPTDVDNLISGSSAFSKSSLYIWKFLVCILLKPNLKDFEPNLADVWKWMQLYGNLNFLWLCLSLRLEWNGPFPVLWLLLSFPNFLAYWVQHFNSIIF